MTPDPYSATVRELFAAPLHAGFLDAGVSVRVDDQDVCLQVSALVAGDAIKALRFRAWGCPHTIAAAEAACRTLEGGSAASLLEFSASGLMQDLSVPVEKTGRILVLEDAIRSLGRKIGDES